MCFLKTIIDAIKWQSTNLSWIWLKISKQHILATKPWSFSETQVPRSVLPWPANCGMNHSKAHFKTWFVASLLRPAVFFKYRSRRPLEAWVSRTWAPKTCCGSWVVKVETWEMCLKLQRWMSLIVVDSACVCDFGWQLQSSRCRNMSRLRSRQIGVSAQVLLSTAFLSSLQNLMTCRDLIVEDFWWWIRVGQVISAVWRVFDFACGSCAQSWAFFLFSNLTGECEQSRDACSFRNCHRQLPNNSGLGECHVIPDAT